MACFCFLFNIMDYQVDGRTPYEARHGKSFQGKIIPLGAEVQYKPNSKSDKERLTTFGGITLPGIFAGYAMDHGGYWNGDMWVIPWHHLEEANNISEVKLRRIPQNEVIVQYFHILSLSTSGRYSTTTRTKTTTTQNQTSKQSISTNQRRTKRTRITATRTRITNR